MKSHDDVLRQFQEEIRSLREENELLRRSARAFGALAERLHVCLQEERRRGHDRRGAQRATVDRRQAAPISSPAPQKVSSKALK